MNSLKDKRYMAALGIPGIDEEKINELYEGDHSIYLPVLRAYAAEMPGVLEKLRNVSAATLKMYISSIHGVKGTSASVCAEEARKSAVKLEAMAKAGDLSGMMVQNEAFLKYMDNLIAGIQKWLIKNNK